MTKSKKIVLSLSVFATMLVALICGFANLNNEKVALGGGH